MKCDGGEWLSEWYVVLWCDIMLWRVVVAKVLSSDEWYVISDEGLDESNGGVDEQEVMNCDVMSNE